MNRLGILYSEAKEVAGLLERLPPEARPQGITTHLAVAENPEHSLTRSQLERFRALRSVLASTCPGAHFHFANGAAIWNQKYFDVAGLSDLVRPGISLYGVPPGRCAGAWRGSAIRFRARVVQMHTLRPGESTGYGARF